MYILGVLYRPPGPISCTMNFRTRAFFHSLKTPLRRVNQVNDSVANEIILLNLHNVMSGQAPLGIDSTRY
ncbi:hypothetical protein SAMN04488135_11823 [Pollutimonas bauzanensis]|uniref:Uncharacterized protein n=1 Tax=Pollutimonas bauzanensis TaxID=658167 RepID=A0A1M5ZSD3_9BURK|nr:hypothetical protein SAMN04488135_11823 [Pollutimonas bauzanensis]